MSITATYLGLTDKQRHKLDYIYKLFDNVLMEKNEYEFFSIKTLS